MADLQQDIRYALNYAYYYLKFRPRTKKEVELYLQKKAEMFHWTEGTIDKSLESLVEDGYINDREFITWFVTSRSKSKQKGTYVLKQELARFGILRDLLDEYFDESPIDEEQLALEALRKKWSSFATYDEKVRFQKAVAFLLRRGFSYDLAKKSIAKMTNSE